MDFQNRVGSKPGAGGLASSSESNVERRERLRRLAMETIDLAKDPYFMKNHLGSYECKLCLTLHTNEGSYLAHTQGKKHQSNLARRAAREARDGANQRVDWSVIRKPRAGPQTALSEGVKKNIIKIGRPGYQVTKIFEPSTRQFGLLFQLQYPEIGVDIRPRHRFMSAFEQRVEEANKNYQYVLFAAEPYETIGFKIQSKEIDKSTSSYFSYWDPDVKRFTLQFLFQNDTPTSAHPYKPPRRPHIPPHANR
ncbi:CWF complex protein sap62 [Dispira parvispora]|uniref:CWF complex protein sap62 n=1 Tax=Dispira parvispora TaxID=1520584 RepID=A0A9W8E6A9_9FUNG|nr:CWF complex protein sap62 [Dispira parvispora]